MTILVVVGVFVLGLIGTSSGVAMMLLGAAGVLSQEMDVWERFGAIVIGIAGLKLMAVSSSLLF